MGLRDWYARWRATWTYSLRELKEIQKEVYDKREPSGEMFESVAMVILEASVWNRVCDEYRLTKFEALWYVLCLCLMVVCIALEIVGITDVL